MSPQLAKRVRNVLNLWMLCGELSSWNYRNGACPPRSFQLCPLPPFCNGWLLTQGGSHPWFVLLVHIR